MGDVHHGLSALFYNPASALILSQILLNSKSFACLIPSLSFFVENLIFNIIPFNKGIFIFSAIKMNDTDTRYNMQNIMLSKTGQSQKAPHCKILYS